MKRKGKLSEWQGRCLAIIGILMLLLAITPSNAVSGDCKELVVIWNAGTCPTAFLDIAKEYTKETGVAMKGAFVPYGPQWHDKMASEFAAKGSGFDIAVWDSQSVAEFAGAGHCELLNERIEKSKLISLDEYEQTALVRYGEYPDNSGKIWALPINQDALGLMYRKDLFENPEEKKAFKAKYGYDLAVPDTYQQAKDIAEFFTRPDQKLYGWAQYGGREYDFATSSSNCFLWSFGGELWNPQTNEIDGYLNSAASIDGLKFYIDMFKYAPPGGTNWGFDEINSAFQQGKVAMAMQWYFFFGSNADPKVSKVADSVGFSNLPGAIGRDGKFRRQFSLGGQGMGINIYSKCVEETWKFIEWYQQYPQQWQYAQTCQSARKDVLSNPDWYKLNDWNKQFSKAMQYTNDYWHIPEYIILLDILQEEVTNAISKKKTVEQALADCVKRQERTLKRAGYKITRTENIPEVPDQMVNPVGMDKVTPISYD
jgi:multiple sugar transport system substrate-binding protein